MAAREDSRTEPEGSDGFPVYRQLAGGGHFYRIDSPDAFQELQRIGSRLAHHAVHAAAYPEKLRIAEMIACAEGRYAPFDSAEWEALYRTIR